ncbi:GntR family transcriptional regulator [Methylobacterium sp. NEAU 140]|uniref:GntR family transcriptional regulator n=1 Tax=Methylobacterium sp. NEAU 140 TaxID=3064945 RepID=UPI00273390F2|nr:GntR family transcriptional regulator [Methylobacterium sp. NEAU 140]MDP4026157.1 GntR family transcriptional regulator [Methylobacterium sp. NEAU 140]
MSGSALDGRTRVDGVSPLDRAGELSLVAAISGRLESMIIAGEIEAGGKLNEFALAQRLQVSRSALREAVRLLEQLGLVTILPNRGVFVRRVSLKEALDLFDVRSGLAYTAGRLAAARGSDEQVSALRGLHEEMVVAWERREIDRYYDLNLRFHADVMAMTGNDRLAALYAMMSNQLHLFRRRNLGNLAQLELSLQEHARILEGIETRDTAKTSRAFERHVMIGKQRMLDTLPMRHDA